MQNLHIASFRGASSTPTPNHLMMNQTLPISLFESTSGDEHQIAEVRASYFSICVKMEQSPWQCGITQLQDQTVLGASDPLGLMRAAHQFRTKTVTPGIL